MQAARCYECPACGGLVREASRVCGYCNTPIATIRCGLCFTMNVPEAHHCMSCGTELGLEPVPAELAVGSQCPHCVRQELDAFSNGDGTLFDCGQCGGQFVSAEVLHAMVRRHEKANIDAPHRYRASNPFDDPVKYIRCPFCGDLMLRHNFGKVSGIIVDVCAKHGTWFDVGELARILAFVGDGGMQRASAFAAEERQRVSLAALQEPTNGIRPFVSLEVDSQPITWEQMKESTRAFVSWVRDQFNQRK
jgi:Zn-finger nucleic acid-binding protein